METTIDVAEEEFGNRVTPPQLSPEDEGHADELTTLLLSTQLEEYSWIKWALTEDKIKEVVKKLSPKIKNDYDYLPRVLYVDEKDFEVWLEQDGHDHFFKWNKGDSKDFQFLSITETTKARIRNLVRLGLCTRRIIEKINLPGSQAFIRHKQGTLQRDNVLTYEDVYNIYHKYISKETQLSKSDSESMQLWMEKLERKGFTVFKKNYFHRVNGVLYGKFAYGFMSPFQRSVYSSNFKHIGLDSTHGTNRSKHELYTIIVRDPASLSAVPVAFLLTNDHSSYSLAHWLSHIKETIGTPENITTDDAQTEYSAIRKAFGESVTVHLCVWHIIRAWSNKFRSVIRAVDGKTGKELREEALGELRTILYDPYLPRALGRIESFKAK
ncbi:hypothetical protein BGX26_000267 [Mortierella sp. AD094]|nr:hypothetical protein BGX26_000267 [Mortierella sp. AD094]